MRAWLGVLLGLALVAPAMAQMRNVGPGVADRVNTVTRGGGEDIIIGGELQTSLELDVNGRRRTQQGAGVLFTQSLLGAYALLPHGFAVNGVLRLEQADRALDGRGSLFRDQTLWADELYVTWTRGPVDIFGGKIHPRFGSAWDRGPGLYGTDFGKEYELTEKLGGGARIWLSDVLGLSQAWGVHNLQAELFTADRSALSSSLISPRVAQSRPVVDPDTGEVTSRTVYHWHNRAGFGGADNSAFLSGTVISLAGYGIPMPRGQAGYTASWSVRRPGSDAVGAGRAATENAGSIAAFWTIPLPQRAILAPFVEYVRQGQAGGFAGRAQDWLTVGFDLRRAPWTLSAAYQGSHATDRRDGSRAGRTEPTASLSYDLYFLAPTPLLRSASVTLGWRRLREGGVSANDFGGLVGWTYKF